MYVCMFALLCLLTGIFPTYLIRLVLFQLTCLTGHISSLSHRFNCNLKLLFVLQVYIFLKIRTYSKMKKKRIKNRCHPGPFATSESAKVAPYYM